MKRLFAIAVLVLLSSAIFFLDPCAAGDPVTKPVKITWTGILYDFAPSASCPAETFQGVNIAKGLSTLFGESDWLGVYCLQFASATSVTGSGWGILTAANGDRLHLSLDVTADLSKDPVEWSETEFIVGGTGRFEGATGASDSHGIYTSGVNAFPFGSSISPLLIQAPQGYVGTTEGEVTF